MEIDPVSQCQRCQKGNGCGLGLPASRQSVFTQWIRLNKSTDNPEHYLIGQSITVHTDAEDSGWLRLVTISFALATFGMIFATLIATWITTGFSTPVGSADRTTDSSTEELVILCSAVIGLASGILFWPRLPNRIFNAAESSLCLQTARIDNAEACCDTQEMHDE